MYKTKTFWATLVALLATLAFTGMAFAGDWGALPTDTPVATSAGPVGPQARMAPAAHTRKQPRSQARIFHVPHGTPYHVENSVEGLRRAKAGHFRSVDWDAQITKDGVVVVSHWSEPMARDGFYDPARQLGKHRDIKTMTYAEVARLRTRDGYVIRSVNEMFAQAKAYGIHVALEVKGDPRFENVNTMLTIKSAALATGANVRIMTLSDLGAHPNLRLRAARNAGFSATLQVHSVVPRAWLSDVDYIRGPWRVK